MSLGKGAGSRTRGRPPLSEDQIREMRARITAVAGRLFRDDGYESVSMRRIASEIGCTPMSLYTYYDSKIDILRSLWTGIFADLFARVAGPNGSLLGTSRTYVRFWLDHPETYRLVFMSAGVTQSDVNLFIETSAASDGYAVFGRALAATTGRSDPGVAEHAQALICGLNGIAHSLITISGVPWAPADRLVEILVQGAVLAADGPS